MNQIKADATAEGQAIGFKEGYEEGKRAAADEAKIKLD
jgi:flagellar biosynthesis/type III secretory pathway protein FliH